MRHSQKSKKNIYNAATRVSQSQRDWRIYRDIALILIDPLKEVVTQHSRSFSDLSYEIKVSEIGQSVQVAVQGFGNVASVAVADMAALGASIVAVSDIHGGIFNEQGLDIKKLIQYFNETGSLVGFDGASTITNEQLLTCECDILIPAATQSQITSHNAGKIQAGIIAEGANAPTTPEADEILNEKGIFIIPDILCNAGGVFVSYLEYTQETQREQMTIEQVQQRLKERMNEWFF